MVLRGLLLQPTAGYVVHAADVKSVDLRKLIDIVALRVVDASGRRRHQRNNGIAAAAAGIADAARRR